MHHSNHRVMKNLNVRLPRIFLLKETTFHLALLKELDTSPSQFTCEVSSLYQLFRNSHFLPVRPTSYSFTSIGPCQTLSNACVASTNIALNLCFMSIDSLMASVRNKLPFDGDVLLVKPRWREFCLGRMSSFDNSKINVFFHNSA